MVRYVKLGRKPLDAGVGHHWAVQVHRDGSATSGSWYEVPGGSGDDEGKDRKGTKRNTIKKSYGFSAASGAGALGGTIVGKTNKTDKEIDSFIEGWENRNPIYGVAEANCQKFGVEFIHWLTDGNYRLNHVMDAGNIQQDLASSSNLAVAQNGQAFASASLCKNIFFYYIKICVCVI